MSGVGRKVVLLRPPTAVADDGEARQRPRKVAGSVGGLAGRVLGALRRTDGEGEVRKTRPERTIAQRSLQVPTNALEVLSRSPEPLAGDGLSDASDISERSDHCTRETRASGNSNGNLNRSKQVRSSDVVGRRGLGAINALLIGAKHDRDLEINRRRDPSPVSDDGDASPPQKRRRVRSAIPGARDRSPSVASQNSVTSLRSASPSPPPVQMRATAKKSLRTALADRAARPAVPRTQPTDSGSSTFQEAVLEHVRTLCGDREDANVLAEYVVAMVAGSKTQEEMSSELEPFFPDRKQAQSFVVWVEECKWRCLVGMSPPKSRPSSPVVRPAGKALSALARMRSTINHESIDSCTFWAPHAPVATQVKPGPHVAVTSRIVLQPNPTFAQALPTAQSASALQVSPTRVSSSAIAVQPQPLSSVNVGQGKRTLLASMTKQLQQILTKLKDKGLDDQTREKYQGLAQSVQMQMAKLTKPEAPKRR